MVGKSSTQSLLDADGGQDLIDAGIGQPVWVLYS